MSDAVKHVTRWVAFAGGILVIAVLYWAQAILVPTAIAILLTFLLAPVVTALEKWIGRAAAVLISVALAFTVLGAGGWAVARQMSRLAEDLPTYRANIRQKVADIRGVGKGGSVEKLQKTLEDIQSEIAKDEPPRGTPAQPVVITSEQAAGPWNFSTWIGPTLEPLATAALVVALVIFMLLERRDLRDRLIGLFGHSRLAVTTKAFDEAAVRVSRYLLLQSLVNAMFGLGVAVGLYFIGVPYFLLWAVLAAVLRFIPYVGPWIGAGAPILVSLAALSGWERPLMVVGLFVGLEVFTNLVLETFLYAGAAGVSQVGLLLAVAFWTWLWGPLGLLLATPLTVCLVVLGKHVAGFEFIATLMADAPALAPDASYYQRLLARDQGEAWDLIEHHVKTHSSETVYDSLLLPALNYAECDRLEGRLSADEEAAVVQATRELMGDVGALNRTLRTEQHPEAQVTRSDLVTAMGYPNMSDADELALHMLGDLLAGSVVSLEVVSTRMLSAEMITRIRERGDSIVCIADLPPSPPSKVRYLIKKLRAAFPELKIVVGRWGPPSVADDDVSSLLDAGANHVSSSLLETRSQLVQLVSHFLQQTPADPSAGAA
jgi:predicted PurR-regulated permease PerM